MELTYARACELFEYRDGLLFRRIAVGPNTKMDKPAGTINKKGYLRVRADGRLYQGSRIIFLMCHGYLPVQVDHKNRTPLDNSSGNLRPASRSQNGANTKTPCTNTTGYKGVDVHRGRWRARVMKDGRSHHLGYFDTAEEAKAAYQEAAIRMYGDFARF